MTKPEINERIAALQASVTQMHREIPEFGEADQILCEAYEKAISRLHNKLQSLKELG